MLLATRNCLLALAGIVLGCIILPRMFVRRLFRSPDILSTLHPDTFPEIDYLLSFGQWSVSNIV